MENSDLESAVTTTYFVKFFKRNGLSAGKLACVQALSRGSGASWGVGRNPTARELARMQRVNRRQLFQKWTNRVIATRTEIILK